MGDRQPIHVSDDAGHVLVPLRRVPVCALLDDEAHFVVTGGNDSLLVKMYASSQPMA